MELPKNYIEILKKRSTNLNQRQEMIKKFVDRLNACSDRKVNPKWIAIKLSPLKTITDLYQFYGECEEANDFGKYFNWATNPKNAKNETNTIKTP